MTGNFIPRIEFHITDHCNLNCKGCSHYSNIAKKKFADIEHFEADVKELSKKFTIGEFKLLGGEPLLHPEITKFFEIARKYLKTTMITLATNCLLLDKMNDNFFKSLRDNSILVVLSKYPPVTAKFGTCLDLLDKHKISIKSIHIANNFLVMRNQKGDSNSVYEYTHCHSRTCRQLQDGKLFICCDAAYMHYYNDYFGKTIPVDTGIDIYQNNKRKIYKYITSPKETCKYCTKPREISWEHSEKQVSEWDA